MSLVIDKIFNYLEVDCLDAEFVLSDKLKPIFASCNFWKKQLMKKVSSDFIFLCPILFFLINSHIFIIFSGSFVQRLEGYV